MNKMTVLPSGKIFDVKNGDNLRNVLIKNGFEIKSTCGGCASCGQCVVKIVVGDDSLSEVGFEEKQLIGNVYHITKERLSCQTLVQGSFTVDISEHAQKAAATPKTLVRKQGEEYEKQEVDAPPAREGGFRKPRAFKTEDKDE